MTLIRTGECQYLGHSTSSVISFLNDPFNRIEIVYLESHDEKTFEPSDNQTLLLQIESLQAQIEEQTNLSKEEIHSLMEDRKVRMEEQQAQRERDSDKIKTLSDHLSKTQTLLYESTKDYLELKYDTRLKETKMDDGA